MLFSRKRTSRWSRLPPCPGGRPRCPCPSATRCSDTPLQGPVPRGRRDGGVRHGLLLGRRADLLAGARRLHHRGRLRGRVSRRTRPTRRCARADRPRRGRARRLRHRRDELRGDAEAVLGGPRPDPGHAPGQRRRQPVPLGDLLPTRPSRPRRRPRAMPTSRCSPRPATARSRPRSPRRRVAGAPFYYAEDYHQQYLAKNPGGYCGLGRHRRGCPVGLASGASATEALAGHAARAEGGRRDDRTRATPPKRGR